MAGCIAKLQLATLVGHQAVFCDAIPNNSQQRKCERGKHTCVLSTIGGGTTKIVGKGESKGRIHFEEDT
jgi:hypothetical protein